MKKRDIIKLVKETIAKRRKKFYGQHDYYGNNVGGRNSISGMPGVWESQGTLASDMLNYADQYHMELVDTMKGVSTYPDKRTGGFYIKFPHFNGPGGRGVFFGRGTVDKIDRSKAAAKAAAQKTVSKFQDQIEDYEITDKSRAGVYGNVHLWIMPKDMNEMHDFEKKHGDKISVDNFRDNPKLQPGKTIIYSGTRYKVLENTGYVLTLQSLESKKTLKVNLNQFISQGAIKEKTMTKLKNPKKADLDKDGKLSSYEKTRGSAIEKNIKEDITDDIGSAEEEVQKATQAKADAEAKLADLRKKKADTAKSALEEYIEKRGDSNLMEHMDRHKKRATLMEGAMKRLFTMFDGGMTDEEVVQDHATKGVEVPEAFISKIRKQWENLKKAELELEMGEKEFKNAARDIVNNPQGSETGMEPPMEEKQLSSGLTN